MIKAVLLSAKQFCPKINNTDGKLFHKTERRILKILDAGDGNLSFKIIFPK